MNITIDGGGREKPYRVWFGNQVYAEFSTLSNAARCRECLEGLVKLGCALPPPPCDVVRDMFQRSLKVVS